MMAKADRQKIVDFKSENDWSYQLIADHFGLTRNQIAGIFFRLRHPANTRISSPNGKNNKIGGGHRGPGEHASYTAYDVRRNVVDEGAPFLEPRV